ncbi:8-oxo-dGTP diphosphatase [Bacillus sp. FJAT-49736]|uniref:NUDIX hydrolase n=1 Tax=Bacillus sp. FJAT-49736 TaxID=2833582 RepID=UPI001BCA31B0|nr:8-oxo-dGTP diphosphatase [Bacillus sp. FJAT-49736]
MEYQYTICFIKRGEQILLLNREKSPWMGIWNGVGGKIEENEYPMESALREVKEETGMELQSIDYKGVVSWFVDGKCVGGMHAFIAEIPDTYEYYTPIKAEEGILDWKDLSWILHPDNAGLANLSYFLPKMLEDSGQYNYQLEYQDDDVVDFKIKAMEEMAFL